MDSTHDAYTTQSHWFNTPSKVKLIIHNQFPGVELTFPLYYREGAECYHTPGQKVCVGFTTQAGFNIDYSQNKSIGTLMYKLQRKDIDEEAISSEEETCIQFIVTWKFGIFGDFYVAPGLIEHDKSYVWNSYKLMELIEYCKLYDIQHGRIEETYLMRDNAVLMTSLNIICEEECYKLEIIISEGSINDNTQRPKYIGLGG
jgi:hypothetical protein